MDRCHRLEELVNAGIAAGDAGMAAGDAGTWLSPNVPAYAVNDRVLLAGQPQPGDWARLAAESFDLVINIRSDPQRAAAQAQTAEAAGLRYVYLNLPAYELEPAHVDAFHQAVAAAGSEARIFIHCRTASRVALLWLLSRMKFDGLTQTAAEAELAAAGYDGDDLEVFRYCTTDYLERAQGLLAAV